MFKYCDDIYGDKGLTLEKCLIDFSSIQFIPIYCI